MTTTDPPPAVTKPSSPPAAEASTPKTAPPPGTKAKAGGKSITITPHGGWRPEGSASNARPTSQHWVGKASDIKIAGMPGQAVFDMVEAMMQSGELLPGGWHLYVSGFVHADNRGTKALW